MVSAPRGRFVVRLRLPTGRYTYLPDVETTPVEDLFGLLGVERAKRYRRREDAQAEADYMTAATPATAAFLGYGPEAHGVYEVEEVAP